MAEKEKKADEADIAVTDEEQEESIILVAQRYLNIFHQIHIFNAERRAEFDESLVQMPDKVRITMVDMPGGRVLLEHVRDLERARGIKSELLQRLIGKKDENSEFALLAKSEEESKSQSEVQPAVAPVAVSGPISLDPDFAKNLASSLATAFRSNNLTPREGNLGELSDVLSKSFNSYASNMQQLTEKMLDQNMAHFNQTQKQIQSSLDQQAGLQNKMQTDWNDHLLANIQKQEDWQQQLQTKVTEQIELQNQIQSRLAEQVNQQNLIQSRFAENMELQNQWQTQVQNQMQSLSMTAANATSAMPQAAAQLNTQNNNANSTTINNINVDSSCFNGLTQTIKEAEEKRSEDFKQIIEVLNKNFAQHNKPQNLPIAAITDSITEALRENSKQQMAAIKTFGEILAASLRETQKELAKTLSQNTAKEKIYVLPEQIQTPASQQSTPREAPQSTDKNNFIKNIGDKISETTAKLAQNLNTPKKDKNKDKDKDKDKDKSKDDIPTLKSETKNQEPQKQEHKPEQKAKSEQKNEPLTQHQTKSEKKSEQKPETKIKAETTSKPPVKSEPKSEEIDLAALLRNEPEPTFEATTDLSLPNTDEIVEDNDTENLLDNILTNKKTDAELDLTDAFLSDVTNESIADKPTANHKTVSEPADLPQQQNEPDLADAFLDNTPAETQLKDTPQVNQKAPQKHTKHSDTNALLSEFLQMTEELTGQSHTSSPTPEIKSEEKPEPVPTPKTKSENKPEQTSVPKTTEVKPQPKKNEPKSQPEPKYQPSKAMASRYDDALQKIKDALQSDESVTLNELDDINTVSLNNDMSEPQEEIAQTFDDVPLENSDFAALFDEPSPTTAEQEWEYVDENGNPLPNDSAEQEWEYVDENGNPLPNDSADDEWEYVDENGNPLPEDSVASTNQPDVPKTP